jgi:acetyl esterase/lipase
MGSDTRAVPLWPSAAPGALGTSSEDTPVLRPFLVPGPEPTGFVVVCPGGGYQCRADHERDPIALWINELGISAAVLEYRVQPYRHPVPLGDALRAIRLVRHRATEWNVDPARVGMLGFSAGGHLAAMAANLWDEGDPADDDPVERRSSRPDLHVLCYPVISFGERGHTGSMQTLLGEAPRAELRRALSMETRVTERTPPAFVWHTAADAAVPVANSLMYAQALADHHVECELHVFPEGHHGLGLARGIPLVGRWTELCAEWFEAQGF